MIKEGNTRKRPWGQLILALAVILVMITFTPVILAPGKIDPKFLSMPFSLWTSIVITIILVLLTFLAGRIRNDE